MDGVDADREWMSIALALGALAEGGTSPNPRVGCLLVRNDEVVGRGFHRAAGKPHAECLAIKEARESARGATLYINLEPCAHQGRTPPCVELIVRSGVGRVVASMQDPDPRVDGRGFEVLRKAGVRVEVGLLASDARRLNEPFVHWQQHHAPLVTLKAAVSLDGQIAAAEGEARWITGPAARCFAHRLRLRHDAVLVGAGTVRRDDPRLTVRLPGESAPRLRVVLSRSLDLDPDASLFDTGQAEDGPVRIYTSQGSANRRTNGYADHVEIVPVSEHDGSLDLGEVLRDLAGLGVRSLLVEGGGKTIAGFLQGGLAQRAALFVASRLLGSRGAVPLVDLRSVARPQLGWRLERERIIPLGEDLLVLGRIVAAN